MKNHFKKTVLAIIILFLVFSSGFFLTSKKAEAAIPVIEIASWNLPKEFGLDFAARIVAQLALSSITNSIVNWINTGFDGNPTFLNNPSDYFRDLANDASGAFISKLGAGNLLCGAFRADILLGLKYSYQIPVMQKFQCTFEDAIYNYDDFMDDFSAGGWEGWLAMTTQPQNNPYGAYLMALDEMEAQAAAKVNTGKLELSWGSGFITLKECEDGGSKESLCTDQCDVDEGPIDAPCYSSCMAESLSDTEICDLSGGQMQNTTPGKVIGDKIAESLGMPEQGLVNADELSEAIAAILNALINQFLNQGLRSLSGGGGGGDGGGGWYETPPTSEEKQKIIDSLDYYIDPEIKYRNAKQDSVDKYDWAISKAEELLACYEQDVESDSEINETKLIISDLEAQMAIFAAEVENSNAILLQAEIIKGAILSSETYEKVNEFMDEFTSDVEPYLHDTQGAADARDEFENTIEPMLEDIVDGIEELLRACRARDN